MITDNRITQRFATMVAWFGAKLDIYDWSDLTHALNLMGLTADLQAQLHHVATEFRTQYSS